MKICSVKTAQERVEKFKIETQEKYKDMVYRNIGLLSLQGYQHYVIDIELKFNDIQKSFITPDFTLAFRRELEDQGYVTLESSCGIITVYWGGEEYNQTYKK